MLFSGTSYLGIDRNPTFQYFVNEGLTLYGNHYGGSRRAPLAPKIYEEAEQYISQWLKQEATLLMSSGTLCGQLIAQYFDNQSFSFYYSPNSHVSAYSHVNGKQSTSWEEWEAQIEQLNKSDSNKIVLISNTINPLFLKATPMDWLQKLSPQKEWIVILDESHTLGVLGEHGSGIAYQLHPPANVELLVMSSLAKACSIPCGLISGSVKIINALKETSLFGGASPSAPAYIHAFMKSKNIYADARKKLLKNIHYLQAKLRKDLSFNHIPGYPVYYFENEKLATYLIDRNIQISSFPYPTPESPMINRLVLNTNHTTDELDKLLKVLYEFQK